MINMTENTNKFVYFCRAKSEDGTVFSTIINFEKRITDKDDMTALRRQLSDMYYTDVVDIISLTFFGRVDDVVVIPDWLKAQAIADMPAVDSALRALVEEPTNDSGVNVVLAVMAAINEARQ